MSRSRPARVGGLDADAGVQAKAATVIPAEHVFGLMGLQEAMAAEMSQDPGTDGVLKALQELVGEGGGFVKAEAGFRMRRILIRIILDPLEEPVGDAKMEMKVGIEAGAEAMKETDRAQSCGSRRPW